MHEAYHSSEHYVNLRKKNKMPCTWIQEDVDTFKAEARDKLFYGGRPCRIVGREEADKIDAEAKQAFMDYLDIEDRIYNKFGLWLRDCGLYKVCAAQVFYEERTKREWVIRDVPLPAVDEFGQPQTDENGELLPAIDPMGQVIPSGQQEWVLEEVTVFRGATTRRVDPSNILFTVDKCDAFDEWPIMVKSYQSRDFFNEPYFFNQEVLDNKEGHTKPDEVAAAKKGMSTTEAERTEKPFEYIEWQGMVDKQRFYEFKYPDDEMKMQQIIPGEKVLVLIGIVDKETIVRCDEDPLKWGRPNVIIGYIDPEEDSPHGRALSQMIECYQKAAEELNAYQLENFKQSVNAMWVINKNALADRKPIINKAGGILLTNDSPMEVARRIEQPRVAPDIYLLLEQYKQSSQNADGIQDIITGRGDKGVETLGESTQVLNQASLKLRDYIRTFEESFVIPLYELRNHINSTFIDQEEAFRVVGAKAMGWRTITPEQMRTPVDFICESASRETNRAVIVQQMLQFAQIAPVAAQLGQPVRVDKMLAKLARDGFGWSTEDIDEYFPLIKMEKMQGGELGIDQMLVQNSMLQTQMPQLQAAMGLSGQELPQPVTETDAINGAAKRNSPPVKRTN